MKGFKPWKISQDELELAVVRTFGLCGLVVVELESLRVWLRYLQLFIPSIVLYRVLSALKAMASGQLSSASSSSRWSLAMLLRPSSVMPSESASIA